MSNLLEAYKNRLAISESVYQKNHFGQKMDSARKLAVAKCLQNISSFMNEAFDNSVGTQRSDLGMFKKFCLNLTTVALPNLISHELVIVHPMASMSGYITYIEYSAGTNKGQTKQGDLFNNPFKLGDVDPNYTSARIVENVTAFEDNGAVVGKLAWAPVYVGDAADAQVKVTTKTGLEIAGLEFTIDSATGVITFTAGVNADDELKVAYVYDNVVIPQNDLPMLKAEMKAIPLIAKARRIAVYYSQIAA